MEFIPCEVLCGAIVVQREKENRRKQMLSPRTYKDGILQGTVITPGSEEPVDIKFVGAPMELMKVAAFLGLEPMRNESDDMAVDGGGTATLFDSRGGYATIAPTERASDLIQSIMQEAQERGFELPPFL